MSDCCLHHRAQELIEGRQRLVKEFTEYRNKCLDLWKEQKPQRLELRDGELEWAQRGVFVSLIVLTL